MAGTIRSVHAREVFDTKGLPTIEVDIILDDGSLGRAAAPGGTSRGSNEAHDLRDEDASYFNGKGVNKAIDNVNREIADALMGKEATDQEAVDALLIELDGTANKSRLGGNTIVATSLANAKAASKSRGIELFEHLGGGREIPIPAVNVMYGGPAYVGVSGTADFQEYKFVALNVKSFREGYIKTLHMYEKLCGIMVKKWKLGIPKLARLAGTLTARFESNNEAFHTMTRLLEEEGYVAKKDFGIYVDMAASQLYRDGKYYLKLDDKELSRESWIQMLVNWCHEYPIISMEDCLFEDDWEGWVKLTEHLGNKVQLVGDDFFVTNPQRLKRGIELGAANAIVIKPNQIGTLTETLQTIKMAKDAGYGTIISPRSGEIRDPYIVHLCIGQNLGQGKLVSCPAGGANLNELIRVQDYLGERAIFSGKNTLSRFL